MASSCLAFCIAVLMLLASNVSIATAFLAPITYPRIATRSRQLFSTTQPTVNALKQELLDLVSSTPTNAPTDRSLTQSILDVVRKLEEECPTPEADVLGALAGNWELLWTAQEKTDQNPVRTWINPLENQSYSNNPNGQEQGRLNPVLPRPVQDRLEQLGVLRKDTEVDAIRSSQSIDLTRRRVRNVVTFGIPAAPFVPTPRRASLTVDVGFQPNPTDLRKVDVKFEACRVVIPKSPIDFTIPLGFFGPTGWLKTNYIDDTMRVTRGHKGSVFVLTRPGATAPSTTSKTS